MSALRQGVIVAREDGYACAWYEIATKGGGIYSKVEEDVAGQGRLEVGTKIWFGMEAGAVGYFATAKPSRGELVQAVIRKAKLYGDERIIVYARTEDTKLRYHISRPWLAAIFGELGSRMTVEQRQRLAQTLEGKSYAIRLWPRSPAFCDLIQPRPRRKRRVVKPRLKALTNSPNVATKNQTLSGVPPRAA